ncbi:MAG: anthrone oxygenase family protein [Planctomycetota bacterium]
MIITLITVVAITGAGVVTGLLFAFSNFVMQALARLPNDHGMHAMQEINEKIINPIFVMFFIGTPLLCAIIGCNALMSFGTTRSILTFFGASLYLVGPFGITMLFNVPLNNRLSKADDSDADVVWPDYQVRWQWWNHIRTYIGITSIALLAFGVTN